MMPRRTSKDEKDEDENKNVPRTTFLSSGMMVPDAQNSALAFSTRAFLVPSGASQATASGSRRARSAGQTTREREHRGGSGTYAE